MKKLKPILFRKFIKQRNLLFILTVSKKYHPKTVCIVVPLSYKK